ncbi:MAG TPA: hypothetical protein VLT33_00705 [Labilithrix sp.]|nr:hypothetical protein [Labilithrix sp.]
MGAGTNRSKLAALVVAGVCGVVAVVGCSASGASDVGGATDDTVPEPSSTAQLPEPPEGGANDLDASKPKPKDAGKDSAIDAGPPPPVPGTKCTVFDEVRKKTCGACGEQETICLGVDGGAGTWSDYGLCAKELANGCIPGTVVSEGCGNCGTRVKTCSQYCAFTTAACLGEPAMACVPGSIELTNAGCADGNTYHQRSCSSTCVPSGFGLTCDAAPTTVQVPPNVGGVSSTIALLSESQVATRLGGTCPSATLTADTTQTPYVYLSVHNPLAKSAVVSIYNSQAPGGLVLKTVLASYGADVPTTDALRKACVKGANSYGTSALTGNTSFASLDATRAVTIGPNETVTVYLAAYNPFVAATPALSTGKVKLNVRTEQVN